MRIHHSTVTNTLKRFHETGGIKERSGRGRKRKLSDKDERKIVRKAQKGEPAAQLAREHEAATGQSIHEQTVRNILHEHGFFYLTVQKVEALSEAAKLNRLNYAVKMKNYDWNQVIFTDEKTFQLGSGQSHAWQQVGKRISRTYTRHPKKLHVWAGAGYYYKTKLYFFTENLDSDLYQKILKARLKEKHIIYAKDCPRRYKGKWKFLQDNDPKHKAASTLEIINDLVGENQIDHPSYSPDLNVQENLWSHLNRQVTAARITSIPALKRKLTYEWNQLPWDVIRVSVNSMANRIEQCIRLQGARTQY
jgi:transposase